MIFNLKFLELINKQIRRKKSVVKEELITEEIDDSNVNKDEVGSFWKHSAENTKSYILENLMLANANGTLDEKFHYLHSSGMEGFAIDLKNRGDSFQYWRMVQRALLERLQIIRYVKQYAGIESSKQEDELSANYKYYLKPSYKLNKSLPMNQLYGNISLELILKNDVPFRFKFLSNTYSDRNYKEPMPFEDLIKYLCKA